MSDMMTFPDTWEEFEKLYGFNDAEEIYTNNSRLIPSFRVKQWLDHLLSVQQEQLDCEDCIKNGGDWECDRVHCHKGDVPDTNVGELISRKAAIDTVEFGITYAKAFDVNTGESKELFKEGNDALKKAVKRLKELPSVQPEIIRCKDGKWWDKEDDMLLGYCLAIKHGFYSRNWDISIRRTYPEDFFCADAELRGEEDEWR